MYKSSKAYRNYGKGHLKYVGGKLFVVVEATPFVKYDEKQVILSMAKALHTHPHLKKNTKLLRDVVFFEYGQKQRTIKKVMRDFEAIEREYNANMYKEIYGFNSLSEALGHKNIEAGAAHAIEHLNTYRYEKELDDACNFASKYIERKCKRSDRPHKRWLDKQDREFKRDWEAWENSNIQIPREK